MSDAPAQSAPASAVKPGSTTTEWLSHKIVLAISGTSALAGLVLAHQTVVATAAHFSPIDLAPALIFALAAKAIMLVSHIHYTNGRNGQKIIDLPATAKDLLAVFRRGLEASGTTANGAGAPGAYEIAAANDRARAEAEALEAARREHEAARHAAVPPTPSAQGSDGAPRAPAGFALAEVLAVVLLALALLLAAGCVKPAVHQTALDLEHHFADFRSRSMPAIYSSPEGVTLTNQLGDKVAEEIYAIEEATK